MAVEYIYKRCEQCKGIGKEISPQQGIPDCLKCEGKGKTLWGYLQDELEGEE